MKNLIAKVIVSIMVLTVAMFARDAKATTTYVSTPGDLAFYADHPTLVSVNGNITLDRNITTTCPLQIEPGYTITTNGYNLTECGPHISQGSYQQYDVDISSTGRVLFNRSNSTNRANEVLVSWFGNTSGAIQAAFDSAQNWTDGGIIRFTEGETYTISETSTMADAPNSIQIMAAGAYFYGGAVNPWFQFRSTYSTDGSKLCVWDGGYFQTDITTETRQSTGYKSGATAFKLVSTRGFEIRNTRISEFETGIKLDNTESTNIHDNSLYGCRYSIMVPNTQYTTYSASIAHNMIATPARANTLCGTNQLCNPLRDYGIIINSRAEKLRIVDNTFDGLWKQNAIYVVDQSATQLGGGTPYTPYTTPLQAPEITGNHIEGWADYCDTGTGTFGCVGQYAIRLYRQGGTSLAGFAALNIERNNIVSPQHNDTQGSYGAHNAAQGNYATCLKLESVHAGTIDNNQFFNGLYDASYKMWAMETDSNMKGLVIGGGNHYEAAWVLNSPTDLPVGFSNWTLDKNYTDMPITTVGTSVDLLTTTVPAGTLGTKSGLKVDASGTAESTNRKILRLYFGSTGFVLYDGSALGDWKIEARIDNKDQLHQRVSYVFWNGSTPTFSTATRSVDTREDTVLKMNTQIYTAGTVTQKEWRVEVQ